MEEDRPYNLSTFVHKEDMGKVIGKQGRVAKAIRTVVYAAGSSQHKKIFLEIRIRRANSPPFFVLQESEIPTFILFGYDSEFKLYAF